MTPHGPTPRARPWVTALSLALLTAAFLWPALVTGAPWAFADTPSYYKGGAAAWAFVLDGLGLRDPASQAAAPAGLPGAAHAQEVAPVAPAAEVQEAEAADRNVRYGIRSAPYSVLVYLLTRFVSLWAPVAAMSLATATLVWLAARDLAPGPRLLLGLGLAAVTALPFFGALFQPDILTAAVVLVPIVLMLHGRYLGLGAVLALLALFGFATLAHYGNLPLAGLAVVWLMGWGLRRGRRLLVGLVAAPLAGALLVNLAVALAIDAGPSLAPGRHPLLLARSIEDGPGRRYLAEACPEAGWALCEVYETMPGNIHAFLWGPRSVSEVATPEQLARVSAEELPLLVAIVRHDPWGQAAAFLRNAARQFVLFGSAGGNPARYRVTPRTMEVELEAVAWRPSVPAGLQVVAVALGAAALLWAVRRRRHPEALPAALFLLVSLVAYAAVCGGLSAPVPRYQARLVWLVPLLGAVLALAPPRPATATATAPAARRP